MLKITVWGVFFIAGCMLTIVNIVSGVDINNILFIPSVSTTWLFGSVVLGGVSSLGKPIPINSLVIPSPAGEG